MTPLFLVCVAVGGTILLVQVAMTFLGMAGHDAAGGDFHGDVGGDFHADAGGDLHGDAGGDVHGAGDAHGGHDAGHTADADHYYSWFFRAVSLRTLTAGVTFFGVGGMAAQSADVPSPVVVVVALACGAAAFYGVYWVMQSLYRLQHEGTARVQRAVGQHASVYLRIPAHESGAGKIQVNLQNRTMEYLAMTSGDAIPTGAKVVVVDVLTPDTVKVELVTEPERIEHA